VVSSSNDHGKDIKPFKMIPLKKRQLVVNCEFLACIFP